MNDDPLPTSPEPKPTRLAVLVANRQRRLAVDRELLRLAVQLVLCDAGIRAGEISVVVVGDRTIRRLNRQFLDHDEPTDVLSFPLERADGYLDGEIVVSAQTACREAVRHGWSGQEELLLYVIHGALHLVGCDDRTARQRRRMRYGEKKYLARLGLGPQPARPTNSRSRRCRCASGRPAARSKGGNAKR